MSNRFNLRSVLAISVLLGLLTACGSATSATPSANQSQASGPSSDQGSASPGAAIPSFDLSSLSGAIPGVDSYRTSSSTDGVVQYETIVVTQPVLSKAITTFDADGTVSTRFVVVGDQVWTAEGADGTFTLVPSATASSMLLAFDPSLMLRAYAGMDWSSAGVGANQGVETKNGVQATHLKIDDTTFAFLATSFPAGASIDIWVADAGYLVAWEMTGFAAGSDMAIEVTAINDPANKVETPN